MEKKKNEKTYVYVIHCEDSDYYKIGVSRRPSYRLLELQPGCPYSLSIVYQLLCVSRKAAFKLENALHKLYWDKRHWNEWFLLGKEEVQHIINLLSIKS